jgi:G3E family GTPase
LIARNRYGIGSFVYRARRPFDPLKLYRVIERKFILLQEEAEEGDETDEDGDNESDADSASADGTASADDSDKMTDEGDASNPIDDAKTLANKKACRYFSGLHRSKGIFWLATRPYQMGSWSTAGAMLTLGSEMPWFCCVPEEDWGADEDTSKAIKSDYEGKWCDRRQELVLIGEKLDVDGLTKLFDDCLLSKAEMRKWEKVMQDEGMDEEEKEEKLQDMWDDSYWAEWARTGEDDEHNHAHSH